MVEYPVLVDSNNTISLDLETTIFDDTIEHIVNIASDPTIYGLTTLGGYYLALKNKFASVTRAFSLCGSSSEVLWKGLVQLTLVNFQHR